jgi:hypothetical protein
VSVPSDSCPPDLALELLLAGELPASSPHQAHLSSCPRCANRLAEMRSVGEAYMKSDAAGALRRELAVRTRSDARKRRAMIGWGLLAPLAAAAAWLLLARTPPDEFVAKGSGTVALLVSHGGQVAPWAGGALASGDPLGLSWTGARASYVAVIGREEGGATVRWFPAEDRAALLEPGTRTFGDSLRFDPPFQGTVYTFVAESPFSTVPLEAAIREGRDPTFSGLASKLRIPRTP